MSAENKNNKIITFGCRLNSFESEAIKQAVAQANLDNSIVFNSCAVTAAAESELAIAIRKARQQNPLAKIIVTGCAAQINPHKYATMPEVDLVLGNVEKANSASYNFNHHQALSSKQELTNLNHTDKLFFANQQQNATSESLLKIKVNDIMSIKETAPHLAISSSDKTRAFLEIQNGCNHRCTFCIIPYGRGNSRSVGLGEIISSIKKLVQSGYQEIVFTGVDISDYGKDLPNPINLATMIDKVLTMVPDLPRLRLSSVDVAELDADFLAVLAKHDRLMPYLHLSVQSGDDLILKRMKRRHSRQQILDFCQLAQQIRPDMAFGADIIAGFPTESDEAFYNSVELIKQANLVFAHIFSYSPRHGTPAAKMPQLAKNIIKTRAKILRKTATEQLQYFMQQQLNKTFSILVEQNNQGKAANFLPIKIINTTIPANSLIKATIIGYNSNHLIATTS